MGHIQLLFSLDTYKCVVRCGFKNGYQEDMGWKEIGVNAQNLLTFEKNENLHFDTD